MSGAEAGLQLLAERSAALPELLCEASRAPLPDLGIDAPRMRRWLVTGIGSSAGNARCLASVLAEELGLPARYVSTAALAADAGGRDATLIVFSQGLSPNASFALAEPQRWGRVVLVTGVAEGQAAPDRVARLRSAQAAGVRVVSLPPTLGAESGALLRVAGPVVAYVAGFALARAIAQDLSLAQDALCVAESALRAAAESASDRAAAVFARSEPLPFNSAHSLALLASGGYTERAANLATKFEEGLLCPAPGCWDALEYAHGPFQQLHGVSAQLLFLARETAPADAESIAALRSSLAPRHALHVLPAQLPGVFSIVDHELLCNALVLRAMTEQAVDACDWPGRGRDAPLYDRSPRLAAASADADASSAAGPARKPAAEFERATSPEVAGGLAAGCTTAVLALGSTEQHGPHLPLGTDTLIGAALAARFCARVPEAQACPTLALGCASEHSSFAGTLSLAPETLEAILGDIAISLNQNGFSQLFIFSAHGGNVAALAEMAERLAARAGALRVLAFTDQRAVGAACFAAAGRFGVSAEAAGHHAGEFETSIVAGLRAGAVRTPLEPGLLRVPPDVQSIFYPDLAANAPNGVVGDPRAAEATRAEVYLAAWVDVLEAAYRVEQKAG